MTHDEQAQVDNWFTYHAPTESDRARYIAIRESCPLSADRTVAIRKVREAVMTANASIACGGK